MAWRFSSDRPVYLQIAQRIQESIVSGEYPPGSQLPSVRQLALEAAVNPNTVQHAFAELENEGIILSKGTTGRFVTEDVQTLEDCRHSMAQQLVHRFLKDIGQLSISAQQAITMIEEVKHEYP
ncbi:MAG: GntR family transcriptional regulator [Oscillospiraceae bacterium]|nr:GntR family transcriptional regulator [Oscillospiraceae bacterium]